METRSRKRAEAKAQRPSNASVSASASASASSSSTAANKRARLSASASASASASTSSSAPPLATPPAASTRRATRASARSGAMDPAADRSNDGVSKRKEEIEKKGKQKESGEEQQEKGQQNNEIGSSEYEDEEDFEDYPEEEDYEEEEEEEGGFSPREGERERERERERDRYRDQDRHGILRRLAYGLPSQGENVGRLKSVLASLRDDCDDFSQIDGLSQLCEILPFATEDMRDRVSIDSFVPILVGFLNREGNWEIMLLAARALTHICDVFPSVCSTVVQSGAIPCFCARLLTIEYIDLAEQCLQALQKISQRHAPACLRAGALMAVLSYLDFFATGVKRVALSTATNISKQLSPDTINFAMEAIPILTTLLSDPDSKVVEHASVCLARIAEAAAASPENMEKLSSCGLVSQAANLISITNSGSIQASLSSPTFMAVIGLLSTCARGSALFTRELLEMGISAIIRDIVAGSGLVLQIPSSLSLNRPIDQLSVIVSLVNDLLPVLPHETISIPAAYNIGSVRKPTSRNSTDNSDREKLLQDKPELLLQFGKDLVPIMIQVYGSSINIQVRHKCLAVISKLLYFSPADMLNPLLQANNISSFLAGVLNGKDNEVILPALQMAEILMQKLPDMFSKMFMKEGFVHAIDKLISLGSDVSGKDKSCVTESSSKTRCNRRASGGSKIEVTAIEETKVLNARKSGSSAVVPSAKLDSKASISAHAKQFKDRYFAANLGATKGGATDSLYKLKKLCKKLNDSLCDSKGKSKGKSKKSRAAANIKDQLSFIADILAEISKDDGVSTFEFVNSGVVTSFLNYFAGGSFSKHNISQAHLMKHYQGTLKRFQSFVDVSLPLNYQEKETPLTTLIRKLQDALASLEHFPVVVGQGPRSHGDIFSNLTGLNALKRSLQLQFRREQGENSLCEYNSGVLHIDPLTNVADVEDYLWSKVKGNETETNFASGVAEPSTHSSAPSQVMSTPVNVESRPSTRSRSSMAMGSISVNSKDSANPRSSKEKGKSVAKSFDDFEGPQTRSGARRRAALKKEPQLKQRREESSEEDEDSYVAPVEVEQAMPMDEGGVSEDFDEEDGEEDEEMFVEEPASVCMVQVGGLELRDPMDTSARASTSATTDVISLQASIRAKGANGNKEHPRLNLYIGGKLLDRSSTLYQAIQQYAVSGGDDHRYSGPNFPRSESHKFWGEVYTITYQRADALPSRDSTETPKMSSTPNVTLIESILQRKLPCGLDKSDTTHDILLLLRVLEELNHLAPRLRAQSLTDAFAEGKLKSLDELKVNGPLVSQEEFLSSKLTSKFARQLQDVVTLCSGGLPPWCHQLTKVCPFLFPFETRRQYFFSTALGLQHALHRLHQQQSTQNSNLANNRGRNVSRLERQKVRVSRKHILESAAKVMELCCGQKAVLEIEYYNEVGTGLGPTLEFYTLISHEMQRSNLGMWRTTEIAETGRSGEFVQASLGLFPHPYPPDMDCSSGSKFFKIRENFCLLGRVMGKALQDGRLLDIPLSAAFYKLVLGKELDLCDIKSFDPGLGSILQEMQALVHRKQYLESMSGDRGEEISNLRFHDANIEDLSFDFTLPGFSDYSLKPGGSNISLNIYNLEEYVSLVVDATIKAGVVSQIEAFRTGFNQVLPISTLQIFTENEMDTLVCGVRDLFVAETLTDHVKFDHGYTAQSPPILNFLEIMAEFTPLQQREFLQFITGCPRLPPGGLGALNPKLTVVRKSSSGPTDSNSSEAVDADLPSVMTCANYLKLPPYSSKEVMRRRLLYAITEGQGSFDLS